jgi:mono/diheme cytochrome c family protein
MLKPTVAFIASFYLFVFALCAHAQEAEPAGKKIFVDQKCNVCHSIDSQGIAKKGPPAKPTDKNPPPDLSNLGAEKSADWIAKFLAKEETLNNKKHPKGWTGKKEDLTTLSSWLATLKKS